MVPPRYKDVAPAVRRRRVLVSVLRSFASAVLLVAAYYVAPLDEQLGPVSWVKFALALLVFLVVVGWLLRAIVRSDTPRLRAIQAAGVGLPLFLVLFAATYVIIQHNVPYSFTERINRTDGLYFTVTVFSTVGLGDIAPLTQGGRIVVMIQMIGGLFLLGVLARLVLTAVAVSERRRTGDTPEQARSPDEGAGERP
jgi:voltage-gated potassium channel